MRRGRVLIGVVLGALVLTLGAAFTARAGDEGKKHADKKVVIFRSGGSWLGVQIADIDADRGKELGLKDVHGAEVQSVSPGSPAEAAGMQAGDVITEYQGTRVEGVAQLTRLVHETPAGRTASLKVFRGGSSKELAVTMKARDDEDVPGGMHVWSADADAEGNMHWMNVPAPPAPPGVDLEGLEDRLRGLGAIGLPGGGRPRLGIGVDTIGKQLSDYFGLKQDGGVLVTSVAKGSQGETAGLKAGDVIVKVDDESITDADDLHSAMMDRRNKALTLTIVRDRREQTLKVPEPPPQPESSDTPHARHAYERDMQRQIERAMRAAQLQAQAAQRSAMVDVRKALANSEKVYRDAVRQAGEAASSVTRENQQKIQEEIQRALEQLRGLQQNLENDHDGDENGDVDATPAPDDDTEVDAIPVSNPQVSTPRGSEEERAAIRRAVEEARRLRIGTQDSDR